MFLFACGQGAGLERGGGGVRIHRTRQRHLYSTHPRRILTKVLLKTSVINATTASAKVYCLLELLLFACQARGSILLKKNFRISGFVVFY